MQDALTPMMQQYRRLRSSIPADTLLLFRLGDFYELFFEDAREAAALLNVALTKRNGVPMCGVPYHAAQSYVAKLIKAGRRVAICDQTSEPQPGKIVSRDITQIISAGTVSDLDLLESKRANYLGAVYINDGVLFSSAMSRSSSSPTLPECLGTTAMRFYRSRRFSLFASILKLNRLTVLAARKCPRPSPPREQSFII